MNTPTKALPANDLRAEARDLLATITVKEHGGGSRTTSYPLNYTDRATSILQRLAAQDAALSAPQAGGAELARLRAIERRCWHMFDDSEDRGTYFVIEKDGHDYAELMRLLPEECPGCTTEDHAAPPSAPANGEAEDVLRGLENWARLSSDETTREFLQEAAALIRRLTRSAGPQEVEHEDSPFLRAPLPVPSDIMQARAQGRAEALAIILELEAETGLDDYIASIPPGPSGEWGSAWNEDKLRELLRADDSAWSLLQAAEGEYWRNLGYADAAEHAYRLQTESTPVPAAHPATRETGVDAVAIPREEVERIVKVLRYAAHPQPSPHADALAQYLAPPAPNVHSQTVSAVTDQLIELLRQRDSAGLAKYGTTLDRTDLTADEWIQHAVEELLDGAGYLLALKRTRSLPLSPGCCA